MDVRQGFVVGPATEYGDAVAFAADRGFEFVELGMNHEFARQRVENLMDSFFDFEPIARAMRETDWTGTCTHEVYSFGTEYVGHGKTAFDRLLDGDSESGSV